MSWDSWPQWEPTLKKQRFTGFGNREPEDSASSTGASNTSYSGSSHWFPAPCSSRASWRSDSSSSDHLKQDDEKFGEGWEKIKSLPGWQKHAEKSEKKKLPHGKPPAPPPPPPPPPPAPLAVSHQGNANDWPDAKTKWCPPANPNSDCHWCRKGECWGCPAKVTSRRMQCKDESKEIGDDFDSSSSLASDNQDDASEKQGNHDYPNSWKSQEGWSRDSREESNWSSSGWRGDAPKESDSWESSSWNSKKGWSRDDREESSWSSSGYPSKWKDDDGGETLHSSGEEGQEEDPEESEVHDSWPWPWRVPESEEGQDDGNERNLEELELEKDETPLEKDEAPGSTISEPQDEAPEASSQKPVMQKPRYQSPAGYRFTLNLLNPDSEVQQMFAVTEEMLQALLSLPTNRVSEPATSSNSNP